MPLTERQQQVAMMVTDGMTNKQIARRLGLSEGTIKVHMHRIFRALGVSNRASLAVRMTVSQGDGKAG